MLGQTWRNHNLAVVVAVFMAVTLGVDFCHHFRLSRVCSALSMTDIWDSAPQNINTLKMIIFQNL
jgi:hypothetical protein